MESQLVTTEGSAPEELKGEEDPDIESFHLAWEISRLKYNGASSAYRTAFNDYIPVWLEFNRIHLEDICIEIHIQGNSTYIVAKIDGVRMEPIEELETTEVEEIANPEPEVVLHTMDTKLPAPEPKPEFLWTPIMELVPGDVIIYNRRDIGVVANLREDEASGRMVLYIEDVAIPIIYGKTDRIKRQES